MLAAVLIAACAAPPPPPQMRYLTDSYATLYLGDEGVIVTKQTRAAQPQEAGYWHGGDVAGKPSIVIDLARQKAFFYKAGEPGDVPDFQRTRRLSNPDGALPHHSEGKGSSFYSLRRLRGFHRECCREKRGYCGRSEAGRDFFRGAPMPYFMRIYGGVGMHAGYLPGVPDSHGCIRLPLRMAQLFYANAPSGTPVTVIH